MATVSLPAGVWTQVRAANFGSALFRVMGADVVMQLAASQPAAGVEEGLLYSMQSTAPPNQPASLWTDNASMVLWGRPLGTGASSVYVE
jgi:hypothetical protein